MQWREKRHESLRKEHVQDSSGSRSAREVGYAAKANVAACSDVSGGSRMVVLHRGGAAMATAEKIVHVSDFTNEPFNDSTKPENRTRLAEALKKVKTELGPE